MFKEIDPAQSFDLDNRFQIIAIPDSDPAEVANIMFYKVGAVDDPAGKCGLLISSSTLRLPRRAGGPRTRVCELRRLGEKQDAFTRHDHGLYQLSLGVALNQCWPWRHRMSKLQLEACWSLLPVNNDMLLKRMRSRIRCRKLCADGGTALITLGRWCCEP